MVLDLKVLAIQRTEAGRWWSFQHVTSPFSRLWLIMDGRAVVKHHGRTFTLKPGRLHLIPPFTIHDCSCASCLDHYHLHLVSRLVGIDLLSLLDSEFEFPASAETLKYLQRLEAIHPESKLPCFDPAREGYRHFPMTAEESGMSWRGRTGWRRMRFFRFF